MEKKHKQFEYARMVMEKNRQELGSKKPPQFPRSPPKQGEENIKRKAVSIHSTLMYCCMFEWLKPSSAVDRVVDYKSGGPVAHLGGDTSFAIYCCVAWHSQETI